MTKTKVLLASRPKMLSEVIRYLIQHQPDMIVIGEVVEPLELLLAVKSTQAEVVIVTPLAGNGEPHICLQLLARYPYLKIVTPSAAGEAIYLYQSDAPKQRIADPSEQSVLAAIRHCVHTESRREGQSVHMKMIQSLGFQMDAVSTLLLYENTKR